jgi:hypothetical protein
LPHPGSSLLLRGGEPFTLQVGTGGEKLFSATRAEQETDAGKPNRLLLYFFALPERGIRLRLETEGNGPVEVECVDMSYDLPLGLDVPAPPPNILLHPRTLAYSRTRLLGLKGR